MISAATDYYHGLLVLLGHKYVLLKLGRFTPKGCQY